MIRERTQCRTCRSRNLHLILDLGKTPLANDFMTPEEAAGEQVSLPLRLVLCTDCSLVQLADTVDPTVLYSRYAYVTSTSRTMDSHLDLLVTRLLNETSMPSGARVVEIASNTGVLLEKFKRRGCNVLGVEPATNIAHIATQAAIPTRNEFFTAATARNLASTWGRADLILGRHVFAHIDDLHDLLAGLEAISHPETLIAFEVPYAVDFFEHTEFDTIYHEHLSYISVAAVAALVAGSPFQLSRVDHYPIHGGSIVFQLRTRASRHQQHSSVAEALDAEARRQLDTTAAWLGFAQRVEHIRRELPALLRRLKQDGRRIIGYGASAKGNTLLNTCGITTRELDYIIDNTPFKQHKLAPGSRIPVRAPDALLQDQPDHALLLAWNFAEEIVGRETEYQLRGGRFIRPIPEPVVIPFQA